MDPISLNKLTPTPATTPTVPVRGVGPGVGEADFAALLRRQLEEVNRAQAEAEQGVENLLTGRADNITEVLTAARKAEIAFSLLMEIRNKLVDAYAELKQLRV